MLLNFLQKNKIKIIISASVALISIVVILFFLLTLLNQKTFYKGLMIEGVDVSGLDRSEARALVEERLNNVINENKLVLNYEDKSWKIELRDISYAFLIDEALDNAYTIGRKGNIVERLRSIMDLKNNGKDIQVASSLSKSQLISFITSIKKQVDKKEKNASVEYKNGNISFDKEIIGRIMDVDKNANLLENRLLERNFSTVSLDVQMVYPKILYDNISDIEEVVASFSTGFNSGKVNRSYNIKLACQRINNKILLPGEVFSMDAALGTRSKANGYKDAPVIMRNQLIEGVGGGVCQVTTTLYVAVLKAKLDVVERSSHSMPLGYVEPGQDATIAEGYIDFKFKNNKDHAFLISASVVGNRIAIRLLSKKDSLNYGVRLKSLIVERMDPPENEIVVDPTVPDGVTEVDKRSVQGLKVAVYRETYDKNNKLVEREKISEDVYRPVRGRIRVSPNYYRHISYHEYQME